MKDVFVPPEVVADRFERLKLVVDRSAVLKHAARVGRVEEILVEGPSKKDATITSGRTPQHKLVHLAAPGGVALTEGTFCNVRITSAASHFLRGELVEITARHRHRVRIPVGVSVGVL